MNAPSSPQKSSPPRWGQRLLRWLHPVETLEEVEGDLAELYTYWYRRAGQMPATLRYVLNMVTVLPPFVRRRQPKPTHYYQPSSISLTMLRNYLHIAWRQLLKHRLFSLINVGGLAMGMAVAILIGLWVYDELSFNKAFPNYDRLTQAHMFQTFNGHIGDQKSVSYPLGKELRDKYPDFEQVAMASWNFEHIVAYQNNKLIQHGMHVEPAFVSMFSVKVIQGSPNGLRDVNAVMLSKTLAQALFGSQDPINKLIKLDNKANLTVTAIYDDFSKNSELAHVGMLTTWAYFTNEQAWVKQSATVWNNNSFQCFALLTKQAKLTSVNDKIKNLILTKRDETERLSKPVLFLFPMSQWHLYSEFKEGINVGGLIQFVWLFGLIGGFVLLLACINFMNLSTARSEKRAKEVGIRKAIGSFRAQLAGQFLSESVLTVVLAFGVAVGSVVLLLSAFNDLADKQLMLPWQNLYFWLTGLGFIALTSLLAGSYPALYLSSFDPVQVLKGTFRVGRLTALPRKVLVVVQFTVSVALIIGTLVVYEQIQYGKNRPVGYDRNGLLAVAMNTPDLQGKHEVLRTDLLATGVVANVSGSSSPLTGSWNNSSGYTWEGKDPSSSPLFSKIFSTLEHAHTAGFHFIAGRDFSKEFSTDTSAVILNEEAVKITRKDILGKYITEPTNNNKKYLVIGIIRNTITESPYEPIRPAFYFLSPENSNVINVKIKPRMSARASLPKIEAVFRKYNPGNPFDYHFVDETYGQKFANEERIGKLALVFAALSIFISCLGLFGLANFMAEQRTKEIGIRKVLGASVVNLWQLLSKDFAGLVLIGSLLSVPIAYYYLSHWLASYAFHANLSWGVFTLAGVGAMAITLLTVSYQAIKAALMNPVKSLRSE